MGSEFESILDPQPEPVEPSLKTSEEELPEGVEHRFIDDDDLDLENIDQLIFETARSLARARLSRGSKKVTFRGDDSRESRIRASITKQYIKTIQAGVGYTGDAVDTKNHRKSDLEMQGLFDKWDTATRRSHDRDGVGWDAIKNRGIVESKKKIAHRSSASSDDTNGDGCVNREVTDVYAESCKERRCIPNTRASQGLQMRECNLCHAGLGDDGVAALSLALQMCTSVISLDLRDNKLGSEGFRAVAHGLSKNPHVKILNLSNNPGPGRDGVAAIGRVLDPSFLAQPAVVELRLANCNLSDAEGAMLLHAMRSNDSVRVLDLSNNNLGLQTSRAMRAFVEDNHTCAYFDLSGNSFNAECAGEISSALSLSRSLSYLSLAANGIGDVGASRIADMIAKNKSIEDIDLSSIRMGPVGAAEIAKALEGQNVHPMRHVYLDNNPMGAEISQRLLSLSRRAAGVTVSDDNVAGENADRFQVETVTLTGVTLESLESRLVAGLKRRDEENKAAVAAAGKKPKKGKGKKEGGKNAKNADATGLILESKFAASGYGAFDPERPDGRYRLDLANPIDLDVATKLWTMERDTDAAASSQSTQSHRRQRIVNVKYQGDCMREDPLAIGWPDHMPAHGILEMDYVTHEGAPAGSELVSADDFEGLRRRVAHPLASPEERLRIIQDVACRNFFLRPTDAEALLWEMESGAERVEALAAMLPRILFDSPGDDVRRMLRGLTQSEQIRFMRRVGTAGAHYSGPFSDINPTGHYELDLGIAAQRAIVVKLAEVSLKTQGEDGGADAVGSSSIPNWRNVAYNDVSVAVACSLPEIPGSSGPWIKPARDVPKSGIIRFDYVATKKSYRHPKTNEYIDGDARLTSDEVERLRDELALEVGRGNRAGYVGRGGIGGGDTMCDFRAVIAHRTTTCAEAAMIVSRINCAETRCEAAVALYGVCVDVDEEEWWRVVAQLGGAEQARVCARLGVWPKAPSSLSRCVPEAPEEPELEPDPEPEPEPQAESGPDASAVEASGEIEGSADAELEEFEALEKAAAEEAAAEVNGVPAVATDVADEVQNDIAQDDAPAENPETAGEGADPTEGEPPAEDDAAGAEEDEEEDDDSDADSEPEPEPEPDPEPEPEDDPPVMRPMSMRYSLDLSDEAQRDILRAACEQAANGEIPWRCFRNLRVNGARTDAVKLIEERKLKRAKKRRASDDPADLETVAPNELFEAITVDTAAAIVDFDFFGADVWDRVDVEPMSGDWVGDRSEQHWVLDHGYLDGYELRLEAERVRCGHPYHLWLLLNDSVEGRVTRSAWTAPDGRLRAVETSVTGQLLADTASLAFQKDWDRSMLAAARRERSAAAKDLASDFDCPLRQYWRALGPDVEGQPGNRKVSTAKTAMGELSLATGGVYPTEERVLSCCALTEESAAARAKFQSSLDEWMARHPDETPEPVSDKRVADANKAGKSDGATGETDDPAPTMPAVERMLTWRAFEALFMTMDFSPEPCSSRFEPPEDAPWWFEPEPAPQSEPGQNEDAEPGPEPAATPKKGGKGGKKGDRAPNEIPPPPPEPDTPVPETPAGEGGEADAAQEASDAGDARKPWPAPATTMPRMPCSGVPTIDAALTSELLEQYPSEPPEAKPIDAGTVARNGDRTAAGYWDGDDMVAAAAGIAPPHDPPSADDDTAEDPIGEAKRK